MNDAPKTVDQALLSLWKEGENPTREQVENWVGAKEDSEVTPESVGNMLEYFVNSGSVRLEDDRYVPGFHMEQADPDSESTGQMVMEEQTKQAKKK